MRTNTCKIILINHVQVGFEDEDKINGFGTCQAMWNGRIHSKIEKELRSFPSLSYSAPNVITL